MKGQKLALLLCAASLGAHGASSPEQNWPQWRGPLANGTAPHADPPTEWSETKNIKWKFKLPGEGSASPIVWDKLVFVQSAVPKAKTTAAHVNQSPVLFAQATPPPRDGRRRRDGGPGAPGGGFRGESPRDPFQFTLTAVDRATGKVAWQKVLREEVPHEGHHPNDGTFASASPITDGESVFAYFGSRGLYALDMNGNVRWQKDLGKMRIKNAFGEGSSPALSGRTLVVNWDHEGDDFIAAFDKNTGQELWKQQRSESTSWSTPLIVEHGGAKQVVVNASEKVRSYDLSTGRELWSIGPLTANAIPSAVAGDGMVYSMSGFRGAALFAIKLGHTGNLAGTDAIAWSHPKDTPYVPSPLLYQDKLYFFKGNEATLSVLDAKTGKPVIETERLQGLRGVYASPVGANGRIYIIGRDGGAVVLKQATAEVLATNKLDDRFDASPAVVGQELFLRGKQHLYCIAPGMGERAEAK